MVGCAVGDGRWQSCLVQWVRAIYRAVYRGYRCGYRFILGIFWVQDPLDNPLDTTTHSWLETVWLGREQVLFPSAAPLGQWGNRILWVDRRLCWESSPYPYGNYG